MDTKAAIFRETGVPVPIEQVQMDAPKAGEVAIRMAGAGVCHSDYHTVDGHKAAAATPMILGHEGAGIVSDVGDGVQDITPGDNVILSLDALCGKCRNCISGHPSLCETNFTYGATMPDGTTRFSQNGQQVYHRTPTFTEHTIAPADKCVIVPPDTDLTRACLISCGVITGVGAVVNRANVPTGASMAVFGCGGVGLSVVQGGALASAGKIIAVDTVERKLEMASNMGATHLVNAAKEDPVKRIQEITAGGADYAFEVVGQPAIAKQAFESTRPLGTMVLVGVVPTDAEISVDGWELLRGRSILGNWHGDGNPRKDFLWMLDLYAQGKLKLDEMITKFRPLEELNEAFADMNAGVTARTVLTFD